MSHQLQTAPAVVGWRATAAAPSRVPWEQLEALGWLPVDPVRIVIQVGQGGRSSLALETARSCADFLHERMPAVTIHVLDPAARNGEWGAFRVYDVTAEEPFCVAGVAARRGLSVPALWFESFYLITVAAAHADRATRLAGVLDAQADPLRPLRNPYRSEVLMYEAHRLAASDLSIACGAARWGDSTAERWWAVSASDVAVDHAVASAAGIDPAQLPVLQAFACHELMAARVELQGNLPRLHGFVAPGWMASAHRAGSRVIASQRAVAHDLTMVRRNLHKIPGFVRRQLAARKRGAA